MQNRFYLLVAAAAVLASWGVPPFTSSPLAFATEPPEHRSFDIEEDLRVPVFFSAAKGQASEAVREAGK